MWKFLFHPSSALVIGFALIYFYQGVGFGFLMGLAYSFMAIVLSPDLFKPLGANEKEPGSY